MAAGGGSEASASQQGVRRAPPLVRPNRLHRCSPHNCPQHVPTRHLFVLNQRLLCGGIQALVCQSRHLLAGLQAEWAGAMWLGAVHMQPSKQASKQAAPVWLLGLCHRILSPGPPFQQQADVPAAPPLPRSSSKDHGPQHACGRGPIGQVGWGRVQLKSAGSSRGRLGSLYGLQQEAG